LHPFDIKAAFLAKHAQHVVLIHFPIALFFIGVLFDVLARGAKRSMFAAAAYCNLAAAAIATVPVLVTGILAWQFALEGQRLKGILLQHLVLGSVSTVMIWFVFWIHFRARRNDSETLPAYRLPIEALVVAVVMLTGHLGGFLSGVNAPS
jgi:uncharacterized membrane protein